MWDVEFTEYFEQWWESLTESQQISVRAHVLVLRERGPQLGRPYVDTVQGSRHRNLKELRVQHRGRPYRIFFAFDPRRTAVLLIGGDKSGDKRFYDRMIPEADRIYDEHLDQLKEGEP